MKLGNIKIRTQLLVQNGIILAAMIAISAVFVNSSKKLLDCSHWVTHTHEVIGEANSLLGYIVDQETGVRGFAVGGDPEFLDPYNSGTKNFDELMAKLQNTVSDNPAQVERLEGINKDALEWRENVAEYYIEERNNISEGETKSQEMEAFHIMFNLKQGKSYMDKIRGEFKTFIDIEAGLLDVRKAEAEATASFTSNIAIFGTLGAVIFGILIVMLIVNSIMGGLKKSISIADSMANGDLNIKIKSEGSNEIGQLQGSMKNMLDKIREVVVGVSGGSENISSASLQMSSNSQQVSQGATEQASSAEEVSSSMEEMVSNIQQNTDNSQQTEKIAIKAADDILEGSKSVNETVVSMNQIADKISIISDIAFQTNILALNAAVEAARAGEHGKGFAVVAAEVRKLAERSQVAATEINDLSQSSVTTAEKSGKLLEEIVPDIQKTAKLVQEISAASMEQNSGADQINNAINELNKVIQQNAAASEEMATSSEELSSQAESLQEMISFFKFTSNKKIKIQSNISKSFKDVKIGGSMNEMPLRKVKEETPHKVLSEGANINMKTATSSDNEFESF